MQQYQKSILSAAIMTALGLSCAVAQAEVTVYGRLYPMVDFYNYSGATNSNGKALNSLVGKSAGGGNYSQTTEEASNSRLGFRGSEDLGGGLKAMFQMEMGVRVDDGVSAKAGSLFDRDTFVGLASDKFGSVKLGSMDTVYKQIGDTLSFLGISSGNFVSLSNILSKVALGGGKAKFHDRIGNTVLYESPEIAGFQVLSGYSMGEKTTNFRDGSNWSNGITYTSGPLYIALANEVRINAFGGSNSVDKSVANLDSSKVPLAGVSSKDTATRFTAQYKFTPKTRVEANLAKLKLSETGGTAGHFSEYKTTTWSIAGEQKFNAVTLVAGYGQQSAGSCALVNTAVCTTTGLGAKLLSLGVGYSLSKRTMLYGIAAWMRNNEASSGSNVGDGTKPLVGQDVQQIALGIRHDF